MRSSDLDRYLATLYVPPAARSAAFALHALDLEIAGVVRSTTEPMLGQIRLAWWREQLQALDAGTVGAAPVLQALSADVLPRGVSGASLEPLEDAGLLLLQERLSRSQLDEYAAARGATLFEAILRTGGKPLDAAVIAAVRNAGAAWALAELLRGFDPASYDVRAAVELANERLQALAAAPRLPAEARPLGGLARLAGLDVAAVAKADFDPAKVDWRRGTPARQIRLLWSIVTGR